MPNELGVPVNLARAMKWNPVNLALRIRDLERLRAVRRETDAPKGDQDHPVLSPVVIAQLETPARELRVPPDAA